MTCTQEQQLWFALLRVCQTCFTQHQEFVKVVYLLLCVFAVQLIGSCDTVLVVLELTLATSISPTSTIRWWRSPFYRWSYEIRLRFSKFRGISLAKTKIQNIGTGDAPRTVHIDNQAVETVSKFTYLGSDIDSESYSYPEIGLHRRLGIAGSILPNLTTFGVSKDFVSPPSSGYTPLLCSR